MNSVLRAAIVRVRNANRAIVGGGFLVADRRVLTCAHVVADALGMDRSDPQRPEVEVSLDFPLLPGAPTTTARVNVWQPLGPGDNGGPSHGDIAVLELLHAPPTGAQPVRRVLAGNLWRRRFGAFGFPLGRDDGAYTFGRCLGPQAAGWIHVESTGEYRIEGGYSGAPLWDEEWDLVIGMVVAAEGTRAVRAAWIVPVTTLADLCPELHVVSLAETASAVPAAGIPQPVFRVPPRNPIFTGREQLLTDLDAVLASNAPTALVQAITGLGGAGKTHVAIEYAHRHRHDYRLVWWLRAQTLETMLDDLAALAAPLGLSIPAQLPPTHIAAAVRRELEANPGWLLVVDNADSLDVVRDHLPSGGHVLITSRNPAWHARATVLAVDVWSPEEAVAFLLARTGRTDAGGASALAEALGYLPLALEQAGAYMDANGTSFARYLHVYHARGGATLLAQHGPHDYGATVATTWRLSFDQVKKAVPAAGELLEVCALLTPEAIPEDLFDPEDRSILPQGLRKASGDVFDTACGVLRRYSLVQRGDAGLSLHRLVQDAVREALPSQRLRRRVTSAVLLLRGAFPESSDDVRTWDRCAQLLPHALTVAGHAERIGAEPATTSWLLDRVATYLQERAELTPARQLFERALLLTEAACGPDHPSVAIRVNNLAGVLKRLGDLEGARRGFERALLLTEAAHEPDDLKVAEAVNNLAGVYGDLGDLTVARQGYERALAIDVAAYGLDHPSVARAVNNLAMVQQNLGDLEGARRGFERALAIDQAAYGLDHPKIAIRANNLASVLHELGDLEGARRGFERALALDDAAYGPDHPNVARDVNNLARVLQEFGDLEGARRGFERALAIDEAAYGLDHPIVATFLNNLARVLRGLGDLEGARRGFERALVIDAAAYGPNHPNVARDVNNLAHILQDLGDLEGARRGFERALAMITTAWGSDHPHAVHIAHNLGSLRGCT